ncbi:hypothetical protein EDB19DRAFT_1918944 [Suillus lakei]|nr:hypothetical protein EDB19DRAFT_1918944 [Suillus lakei]
MSTNSNSASSNNAVNTLVAALMGLNMSPVTANTIVMVIQAITSGEPSIQLALPPVHIPEHADEAAEAGVHADHATSDVIPAETPPPPINISPMLPSGNSPTTTTTLVPTAVTPTTTTPVPTTVTPTYAHPVTFPPSFVSILTQK